MTGNNEILISRIAEQDIDDVITYLAKENTNAAYDFIDALYTAFDKIADNPYIGHLREDLTNHPIRFWTFKWHYLIIYKPTNPLEIVRVLSGFRDILNLL